MYSPLGESLDTSADSLRWLICARCASAPLYAGLPPELSSNQLIEHVFIGFHAARLHQPNRGQTISLLAETDC